nr:MAG: hypothetical protein [Microvirus Sku117]
MTRKDKEELIKRLEERMPELEKARNSPYLSGRRDAYLSAIIIITECWFEKEYSEVSINE